MKLDVTKIFHPSQMASFLADEFDEVSNHVEVGDITDILIDSKSIVPLMEEWVRRIESVKDELKRLELITKQPVQNSVFAMLQHERGLTLEEFKELFYTSTEDKHDWTKYQGFRLFNIISERQRLQFINKYTSDAEGYVQALMQANLSIMRFFLNGQLKAKIPLPELFAHTHIVAPSGWGKSELMKTLFYELATKYAQYSFIIIDPHGKLAEEIKRLHISTNKDRFIYIHPFLNEGLYPSGQTH